MNRSYFFAALMMVSASCCVQASAQTTLSADDQGAILDAKINLLNKQKAYNQAMRDAAPNGASSLPTLVSVSIVGSQRSALLQLPTGGSDHFHIGDEIQSNVVVESITLRKVVVAMKQGKKSTPITLMPAQPINNQPGQIGDQSRVTQPTPVELLPVPPTVPIPSIAPLRYAPAQLPMPTAIPQPSPSAQAAPLPSTAAQPKH